MLPESTLFIRIAAVLGQKADYFFRPFTISLENVAFRKRDGLGERSVLKIIPKAVSERFWDLARQNKLEIGWGKYEGKEASGRFRQLLYKAVAEEVISIGKAAALANTSVSELKNQLQLI